MIKMTFPDRGRGFQTALAMVIRKEHKESTQVVNEEGLRLAHETRRQIPIAQRAHLKHKFGTPGKPSRLAIRTVSRRLGRGTPKAVLMQKTRAFVASIMRAPGYIRAGQNKIINAFGGNARPVNPRSHAAESYGKKASNTQVIPTAWLSNHSTGSGRYGAEGLERAIGIRAGKMLRRLQKGVQVIFKEHSAR